MVQEARTEAENAKAANMELQVGLEGQMLEFEGRLAALFDKTIMESEVDHEVDLGKFDPKNWAGNDNDIENHASSEVGKKKTRVPRTMLI